MQVGTESMGGINKSHQLWFQFLWKGKACYLWDKSDEHVQIRNRGQNMFQQKVARLTDVPKYIEDNKLGAPQNLKSLVSLSMNNLITWGPNYGEPADLPLHLAFLPLGPWVLQWKILGGPNRIANNMLFFGFGTLLNITKLIQLAQFTFTQLRVQSSVFVDATPQIGDPTASESKRLFRLSTWRVIQSTAPGYDSVWAYRILQNWRPT